MECEKKITNAFESIKSQIPFIPKAALVLGSGLGGFADKLNIEGVIPYNQIKDFPVSTVQGHKGQFVFAKVGEVPLVIMQGRVHYYEGYQMDDVVLPIRLMRLMGAKILILTNAAGGANKSVAAGDLMMITDHIAKFVPSCLVGKNPDFLGERFPDMSCIYDKSLCDIIRSCAVSNGISLKEGTYLQFTGPEYETPAEIRMAALLGADAVGMSTACEAVAANHMGMRVCGISCITNMASGLNDTPLNHLEVQQIADKVSEKFCSLVSDVIFELEKV